MRIPRPQYPPAHLPLLTCPQCLRPMRIATMEIADGREHITFICDQCKNEATQEQSV